ELPGVAGQLRVELRRRERRQRTVRQRVVADAPALPAELGEPGEVEMGARERVARKALPPRVGDGVRGGRLRLGLGEQPGRLERPTKPAGQDRRRALAVPEVLEQREQD